VSAKPLYANYCRTTTRKWCQRKRLLAASITLLLAIPGIANSLTLEQLLDMPIERLLRLEITSMQLSQVAIGPSPAASGPHTAEHRDAT
jgi:hypothetical protein